MGIISFVVYILIYVVGALIFIAGGIVFLSLAKKEVQNKDSFCEICGNKVSPNSAFCNNCGNKLHVNYNDSKRVAFLIIGVFLLVQGISCLLGAIFQGIFRIIIKYIYMYFF